MRSCLFGAAFWSPDGMDLICWLSCVCCFFVLSLSRVVSWVGCDHVLGVVLDCIDSWSLPPCLLPTSTYLLTEKTLSTEACSCDRTNDNLITVRTLSYSASCICENKSSILFSFAIIFTRKRKLDALLLFSYRCYYKCSVAFPDCAVGWSAVCDCGIFWSYSLTLLCTMKPQNFSDPIERKWFRKLENCSKIAPQSDYCTLLALINTVSIVCQNWP